MSFLKSLFGGKDESKKSSCCDVKIVEVKQEETAATSCCNTPTETEQK